MSFDFDKILKITTAFIAFSRVPSADTEISFRSPLLKSGGLFFLPLLFYENHY